ncbi:MAG: class I SAM-dependent methyltransferase [Pseudomonadota bacterium]
MRLSNLEFVTRIGQRFSGLQLNETVFAEDPMFDGNKNGYLATAKSALHAVQGCLDLKAVKHEEIQSILDFGCGHGRVTRAFVAHWPDADVTAYDILEEGVRFCEKELGCRAMLGPQDIGETALQAEQYDLIFCGSIFTHLDVEEFNFLLGHLARALKPNGTLVFTTAGHFVAKLVEAGYKGGVRPNVARTMLGSFYENGFGFGFYTGYEHRRWGWTLAAPWWIARSVDKQGLQLLSLMERGWGGRQDVVAVHKWQ